MHIDSSTFVSVPAPEHIFGTSGTGRTVVHISGSILWDTPGGIHEQDDPHSATISWSLTPGGWTGDGEGNLDADPRFRGYPLETGRTWTAVSYDVDRVQTVLTDEGAGWTPGALRDLFVRPTMDDPRWGYIYDNDEDTLWMWGDVTDRVSLGSAYELYDLRLQPDSPCIDAGDPDNDGYCAEPEPNGCQVNMGAFGGTDQATSSSEPETPHCTCEETEVFR